MKKGIIFTCIFILLLMSGCGRGPALLNVGDPAPDFTLVDRQGKTWTLSDLKGQVVFINFWATWCPPCLKELPSMQKLHDMMPENGFTMLAVLNKDKPNMADFVVKQKGITIPVLDDSENKVGSTYRLTGLPETFIVDKNGIIREKVIGAAQWDAPQYVELMNRYIRQ